MTDSTRSVILVSNDDGIHAPGIAALAKALDPLGEVWVVAPDRERSAVGHALTLHRPIVADQLGPRRFAVNGTPSDCVNLALLGLLPVRPHIVVAGVNAGSNLGDDVTYSGTVSAAMEGTLLGVPGLAVSLVKPTGPASYRPAARAAAQLVRRLLRDRPGGATLVNVNVPPRRASRDQGDAARPPRSTARRSWSGRTPAAGATSGSGPARRRGRRGRTRTTPPSTPATCRSRPCMLDLTDYAALRTVKDWEMEYRPRRRRKRGPWPGSQGRSDERPARWGPAPAGRKRGRPASGSAWWRSSWSAAASPMPACSTPCGGCRAIGSWRRRCGTAPTATTRCRSARTRRSRSRTSSGP